jgi:hypothetical protein
VSRDGQIVHGAIGLHEVNRPLPGLNVPSSDVGPWAWRSNPMIRRAVRYARIAYVIAREVYRDWDLSTGL